MVIASSQAPSSAGKMKRVLRDENTKCHVRPGNPGKGGTGIMERMRAARRSFSFFSFKRGLDVVQGATFMQSRSRLQACFGRLKARACTGSKINLNPLGAYHRKYADTLLRQKAHTHGDKKYLEICSVFHIPLSRVLVFRQDCQKVSSVSLPRSFLSPTPLPDRCPTWQLARLGRNALPSIVLGLSFSTGRCCYRCLRSGEAWVWFLFL